MVVRKISKNRYLLAFMITLVVFILGLLLGLVIESKRTSYLNEKYQKHSLDFQSSQLQFTYLLTLKDKSSCDLVYQGLDQALNELGKTEEKLIEYQFDNKISETEFELLRRQYILEELRYSFLSKNVKDYCDLDFIRLIFFYTKKCPDCDKQAVVLDYFKNLFKQKLLIFPVDESLEEPLIRLIKTQYNITSYPTLIIDEKKFSFLSKDELFKRICQKLPQEELCQKQ